jgi:peptide/nickel transport system substrate-binding protein
MNVWLSSASTHAWNPRQKAPETAWEAEIDKLMLAQAAMLDNGKRRAAFDRVQQIAWEQQPLIYLVHPNALSVVAPQLRNVAVSVLRPQTWWNIERLAWPTAGEAAP